MIRGRSARVILLILMAGVAIVGFAQDGSAQDGSDRAILQVGPTRARGLLFLPVNVIDHYVGEYAARGNSITVYYTETHIEPFEEWDAYSCGNVTLRIVEETDDHIIVYLVHDDGWELFVRGERSDLLCTFIAIFTRRLRYFQEVTEPGSVPPFPAILDLR